ncbi:MAG TPA: biotin/lipoyl-containing protein [Streptosporangiaceae bacterium]
MSPADDGPPALLSSEDVKDILRLLDGLGFGEFTLETGRFTIRLTRAADGGWAQQTQVVTGPVAAAEAAAAAGAPPAAGPAGAADGTWIEDKGHALAAALPGPGPAAAADGGWREIRAPLPGTFYRAPQPGAPPYVEVGSLVGTGTVVALIETMKLMNPVYAGTAGMVSEICLADGQFADSGVVLMRVAAPSPAAG